MMGAAPWNHDGIYDFLDGEELFSLRDDDDWLFVYRLAVMMAGELDGDQPVNLKFDGSDWFVYRDGSYNSVEDDY